MKRGIGIAVPEVIERRIILLRGQRVILDSHIAELYGVETKDLKRAVRRNRERFPNDFLFELTAEELAGLRLQFATSKSTLRVVDQSEMLSYGLRSREMAMRPRSRGAFGS